MQSVACDPPHSCLRRRHARFAAWVESRDPTLTFVLRPARKRLSPSRSNDARSKFVRELGIDALQDQRLVFCRAFGADFCAMFCHAMVSALRSVVGSAFASRTLVLPCLPHPPGTGRKISGSASTRIDCCSGVSFTIPHSSSG